MSDLALALRTAHRLAPLMPPRPSPRPPELDVPASLLGRLEQLLGDERYTLRRRAGGDWEARTMAGEVGFGETLKEAIEALCATVS